MEDDSTTQPSTLIVAWRMGKKAHGRVVKAGGDVVDQLRSYAATADEKTGSGSSRDYDPNDEQDEELDFLTADREELLDTALLEQVQKGASLPKVDPEELRGKTLALYALVTGTDPENLTIYIRKKNPVQLAKKGLVAIFDDTLSRIEKPILAFDSFFDVVLKSDRVEVLHQKNFELLFKESEAVLASTQQWAEELDEELPIAIDGVDFLAQRLRENSVIRRRVLSIRKSGYLDNLTPDLLREKMLERKLDPDVLIKDECLVFNKDTERDILLLLNEDLWTGDFSGEQYSATRKARR
ncbi:Kiwa anti-phage protein KwaB-like domain-containing protein [Amycolatopsis sp. NPDC052450]|uniref:Kiwa anti-phage protein KwaB-like domain-containing protein n=1 Tax=Amycolatopsis sp. NPDC052450 TaxID=3363937 RepID=UPI0037C79CA0